jgi:hypothetical protein
LFHEAVSRKCGFAGVFKGGFGKSAYFVMVFCGEIVVIRAQIVVLRRTFFGSENFPIFQN